MDIDRYIQRNEPTWRRLGQLSRRAGRGVGRLSDDEISELVTLYQRVSAQLSHARGTYADPELTARLSRILGEARVVIYRRRSNPFRAFLGFFTTTFPAAVWHARRFVAVAFLVFMVPAVSLGIWLANSSKVLDASVPPELQKVIAEREFSDYYRTDAAENFAGHVSLNNTFVAFQAFALGVVPVIGPVSVLAYNGANVGEMGAVMHHAGEGPQFWGLILPHGLLEITSILIAAAAGLQVSWAIIAPGERTRGEALKDAGLRSVVIVMGLAVCFLIAGFIEGFVTPSGLPTSVRVGIGVAVLAAFVSYITILGIRAERAGLTGLLAELSRDDADATDDTETPADGGVVSSARQR